MCAVALWMVVFALMAYGCFLLWPTVKIIAAAGLPEPDYIPYMIPFLLEFDHVAPKFDHVAPLFRILVQRRLTPVGSPDDRVFIKMSIRIGSIK